VVLFWCSVLAGVQTTGKRSRPQERTRQARNDSEGGGGCLACKAF